MHVFFTTSCCRVYSAVSLLFIYFAFSPLFEVSQCFSCTPLCLVLSNRISHRSLLTAHLTSCPSPLVLFPPRLPSSFCALSPTLDHLSIDLKGATGLPLMVSQAFVQYEVGGQLYTTETVEQDTHNPQLEYSFMHHVERVSTEVCGLVLTSSLSLSLLLIDHGWCAAVAIVNMFWIVRVTSRPTSTVRVAFCADRSFDMSLQSLSLPESCTSP